MEYEKARKDNKAAKERAAKQEQMAKKKAAGGAPQGKMDNLISSLQDTEALRNRRNVRLGGPARCVFSFFFFLFFKSLTLLPKLC